MIVGDLELREKAILNLKALAAEFHTREDQLVFVLGPYQPATSSDLLDAVVWRLREARYTAFLEKEVQLHISYALTLRILFELSTVAVFVITSEGLDRGWQVELGDLCRSENSARKIVVGYEEQSKLPTPITDLLLTWRPRHGRLVFPQDPSRTVDAFLQWVNTHFYQVV